MREDYATLDDLKEYLRQGAQTITSANDASYSIALDAAHQAVDDWCGRTFVATTSASARIYVADSCRLADDATVLKVDDFWDTATLVVTSDSGGDGTYETSYTYSTQLQAEPLNGISGGVHGHAYWKLRLISGLSWPTPVYGRANVSVTAKWGWAAVPSPVKSVTLELAKDIAMSATFRAGQVGFADAGIARIRDTPSLEYRLRNYRHPDTFPMA